MNFFDGGFKSKPNINLSGSSKIKSRDDLLKEAALERKKREAEKRQQAAATKIQAVFRSFLVRQKIHEEQRKNFDQLLQSKTWNLSDNDLRTILKEFISFFNIRYDTDRLVKISNLIAKHKELVLESMYKNTSDAQSYVLAKFLIIQIRWLTESSKSSSQSQSLHLRIVDYFTDPNAHSKFDQNNQASNISRILFSHLIKNDYIKKLVEFSMIKIPDSVRYVSSIPIAQSISDLFYRCFLHLEENSPNSDQLSEINKNIINALFDDLFAQADKPQVKCVIENLSVLVLNNSERGQHFEKLNDFLLAFERIIINQFKREEQEEEEEQHNVYKNQSELSYVVSHSKSNASQKSLYSIENVKKDLNKLYALLKISLRSIDRFAHNQVKCFLYDASYFLNKVFVLNLDMDNRLNEKDLDEEMVYTDTIQFYQSIELNILSECVKMFNSNELIAKIEHSLNQIVQSNSSSSSIQNLNEFCIYISHIANFILLNSKTKTHQSIFLRKLAFNRAFLYNLWQAICSLQAKSQLKQDIYILQILATGSFSEKFHADLFRLVAPLSTFCSLYNLFLLAILDEEFIRGEAIFSKMDLIKMSSILKDACIGLIVLMHPDPETASFTSSSSGSFNQQLNKNKSLAELKIKAKYFTHLFHNCCHLVQRIYTRDIRRGFCPEEHWISNSKFTASNRLSSILNLHEQSILTQVKFGQQSYLFQEDELENNDLKLSLNDIRSLTILQELPFTISFKERVDILETFSYQDSEFPREPAYRLRIRRNFLYEDAFDELSLENIPNLKSKRIVVEMVNQLDLEEAGIDGGGVFREFILQLLETGFDPNRGFFVFTSDGFLYPNPNVSFLHENYKAHYFFLGRILAKAIDAKITSSLKFAGFFLQKILGKHSDSRLDIDYLASLDPQVYKNLISLKDYKHDVKDLELTFCTNSNDFGQTKLVELKQGGKDILVTNDNKIEYIHLLSDYKLNRQIHEQVVAFRNGISNVINLDLLRLFNFHEFQNLICGQNEMIDVEDWKRHTAYSGNYGPTHPVIANFWRIVASFDEDHKKKLLKFATSRSLPPLFGFKNLIPSFAIQNSGSTERLPSASTCLNLLKLPPIEDYDLLKEKLICAIESESGFDLS